VWTWGDNRFGQLAGQPDSEHNRVQAGIAVVSQVAAGGQQHGLASDSSRIASTSHAYDNRYRLTGVTSPSSLTTYVYDPVGNRLTGFTPQRAESVASFFGIAAASVTRQDCSDRLLMPVISFTTGESWFVANYEFRTLFQRTMPKLESEADQYSLAQEIHMGGLHVTLTSIDQSARLARALQTTARELSREFMSNPQADQRDREFGESLGILEQHLSKMLTNPSGDVAHKK
jgi:YD repeat-containing protein